MNKPIKKQTHGSSGKSVALRIVRKYHPNVTRVVDAKKPISITVTNEDDKRSKSKDHKECALATACQRQEHADGAIISVRSAYVIKGNTAIRYRVPSSVSREVVSFDRKGGFSTGTYQLTNYGPNDAIGKVRPGGPQSNNPPQKPVRHTTTNIRTSLLAA